MLRCRAPRGSRHTGRGTSRSKPRDARGRPGGRAAAGVRTGQGMGTAGGRGVGQPPLPPPNTAPGVGQGPARGYGSRFGRVSGGQRPSLPQGDRPKASPPPMGPACRLCGLPETQSCLPSAQGSQPQPAGQSGGEAEGPSPSSAPLGTTDPRLLGSRDPEGQQLRVCLCPCPLFWAFGLQFV